MNNKYIITMALAAVSMDMAAQRITTSHEVIDCGSVRYEQPVTATFEMRNKGEDMLISDIKTSCGCTSVNYPKGYIVRGDSFAISVTYDARQLGHFEKQVAIYSNSLSEPYYLKMRGVVVDEVVDFSGNYPYSIGQVKMDKNDIEFDDVNSGDYPVQKIHLLNSGTTPVSPVVMHLPAYLKATVSPTTIHPGRTGVATVTLDSRKLRDYGLTQTSVFLGMYPGDRVSVDKEISVSAVLLPGFDNMSETQKHNAPVTQLSDKSLELGEFGDKASKTGVITITNTGRSKLDIRSMQMFTVGLKVKLNKTKLQPGETAKLKITAYKKQLKSARSKPRVLMITNDPDNSKVIININVK